MKYKLSNFNYGASGGLAVLALFSDCLIKPGMLFLPVLGGVILLLVLMVTVYFYTILIHPIDNPNQVIITCEGFLEAQTQFYLLFLTPLRIADKYRLTQEVTPAGTILACVLCMASVIGGYVGSVLRFLYLQFGLPEFLNRLVPITLLVVAGILAYRPARRELREELQARREA